MTRHFLARHFAAGWLSSLLGAFRTPNVTGPWSAAVWALLPSACFLPLPPTPQKTLRHLSLRTLECAARMRLSVFTFHTCPARHLPLSDG